MGSSKIKLSIVTENRGKGLEALKILESSGVEAEILTMKKQEIQSDSLEEIALYSARIAYLNIKKPLVVDDSGLFIDSLKGFPGPYSSYVYKKIGVQGILKLMERIEDRRACFKTALAAIIPPLEKVYVGETCGVIADKPRGDMGFGFDPIFIPEGSTRTYAEMSIEEKNRYSHRSKAYQLLLGDLKRLYPHMWRHP